MSAIVHDTFVQLPQETPYAFNTLTLPVLLIFRACKSASSDAALQSDAAPVPRLIPSPTASSMHQIRSTTTPIFGSSESQTGLKTSPCRPLAPSRAIIKTVARIHRTLTAGSPLHPEAEHAEGQGGVRCLRAQANPVLCTSEE